VLKGLTLRVARTVLSEFIVPGFVGAILFALFAKLFFNVSLWSGAAEIRAMDKPLIPWSVVIGISALIGSWSVGGAFRYLLGLYWRWLRVYTAGGK
jgi:hypothetical protein